MSKWFTNRDFEGVFNGTENVTEMVSSKLVKIREKLLKSYEVNGKRWIDLNEIAQNHIDPQAQMELEERLKRDK